MARPSDAPDGWWLTLMWVTDDDGVVSVRLDAADPDDATEDEHDVVTLVGAPGTLAGAVTTSTVRAGERSSQTK